MSAVKSLCVKCGKEEMTFSLANGWKCGNCGYSLVGDRKLPTRDDDVRSIEKVGFDYRTLEGWDTLSEDEKQLFRSLVEDSDLLDLKNRYHRVVERMAKEAVVICIGSTLERMVEASNGADNGSITQENVAQFFSNPEWLDQVTHQVGAVIVKGMEHLSEVEEALDGTIQRKRRE